MYRFVSVTDWISYRIESKKLKDLRFTRLKSKNWIFLREIHEEKTGRRKILLSQLRNFSLFSF
jgi:hypothetical protein